MKDYPPSLSSRLVASRWLVASKSKYRSVLRRGRSRVEAAYRQDDWTAAAAAYEQAASALRPLGGLLDGVTVERQSERRKLKNVRRNLSLIKRYTAPGFLRDTEYQTAYWAWSSWETLEDAVKAVLRVWERVTGYQSLTRSFQHGPFTVENHYGYREEELTAPLSLLSGAMDQIRSRGFEEVLYGVVQIVSPKSGGFCGRYFKNGDFLQINADCQYRLGAVHTVVHELGHRFWFQKMTSAQQKAYDDAYSGTAGVVFSLGDREDMWQAFKEAGYTLRGAHRRLRNPALREHLSDYVRERRKGLLIVPDPRTGFMEAHAQRAFVVPSVRNFFLGRPVSVSDYAETGGVTEDFAEVFAFFCTGKRVDARALERFRDATGR